MMILSKHLKTILLLLLALFICSLLPVKADDQHLEYAISKEAPSFTVLILGDSQMEGENWDGGYERCILKAYPNAKVLNLAKGGSLMGNGDIRKQWEFFVAEDYPMPHIVLLDGGANDLLYTNQMPIDEVLLPSIYKEFTSLVEQIHKASPDTHIIYVSMFPLVEWEDNEIGPPSYKEQNYYWKQISIMTSQYSYVTFLDLFSLNPFHYPCSECSKEYLADSIHMNKAGYKKTFEYIDNILLAQLMQMVND